MACNPRAAVARRRFALIKEVTCGVTPSNPAYQILPHLRGSRMTLNQTFERSDVQDPNRQGGQQIGGSKQASAVILTPVINEIGFDWLMESAIGAALAAVNLTVSVSFTAATKKAARAAGSFLTDAIATRLVVGDKVSPVGSANNKTTLNGAIGASDTTIVLTSAANFPNSGIIAIVTGGVPEFVRYSSKSSNTLTVASTGQGRGAWDSVAASHSNLDAVYPVWTISAVSATELTFTTGSDTLVDEAALSITFWSNRKRAASGTTRTRFSIEDASLDQSLFKTGKGFEGNDWEISVPTSGGARVTFNLIGQDMTLAQESGSTYLATYSNTPTAGSVTGTILTENGSTLTGVESLTLRGRNGREAKFAVGDSAADHVSEGDFDVELEANIYRADLARLTAYLAGTRKAIALRLKDQNVGDAYQFTFPQAVYTRDEDGESGNTITDQCSLFAEKDPTTGSKMIFEKLFA